jgi:hypothetical protein
MKPSRAGVQVMAHSTLPGTPNFGWNSTSPAKGASV